MNYYWNSLYTKIDIIMPYGYAGEYNGLSMYNHLYNFYYYLKITKSKRVIPIIGYNVLMSGVNTLNLDLLAGILVLLKEHYNLLINLEYSTIIMKVVSAICILSLNTFKSIIILLAFRLYYKKCALNNHSAWTAFFSAPFL